ncbi:MAG: hypothetical protein PHQ23_04895 [Candidatus Wallbacteria bacterium]|nr:hypothetical protein [Candidatus Wallbacteria bacterium]
MLNASYRTRRVLATAFYTLPLAKCCALTLIFFLALIHKTAHAAGTIEVNGSILSLGQELFEVKAALQTEGRDLKLITDTGSDSVYALYEKRSPDSHVFVWFDAGGKLKRLERVWPEYSTGSTYDLVRGLFGMAETLARERGSQGRMSAVTCCGGMYKISISWDDFSLEFGSHQDIARSKEVYLKSVLAEPGK